MCSSRPARRLEARSARHGRARVDGHAVRCDPSRRAVNASRLGGGRGPGPRRRRRPPGVRRRHAGGRSGAPRRGSTDRLAPDLEVAGDLVSVVDRGPDAGAIELALLRADSGQPVRRIRPACARVERRGSTPTQAEHAGERVILALGRAGTASCFEAWDLRRGTRVWRDAAPAARQPDRREPPAVVRGERPERRPRAGERRPERQGAVWALALDTGRLRSLRRGRGLRDAGARRPRRRALLLRATRQRGTIRDELWAMDLEKGSMLWEQAPRGRRRRRPAALDGPRGAGGRRRSIMALDRPNRLAYETLDLRTGRSLASVTTEVETASWDGTAWTDEAAWLTIASPYRVAFGAGHRDARLAVAEPRQLPEHRRQGRLHAMKKTGMRRGLSSSGRPITAATSSGCCRRRSAARPPS